MNRTIALNKIYNLPIYQQKCRKVCCEIDIHRRHGGNNQEIE